MKQKFIFCLVLLTACNSGRKEFLTFPYSQWTVGSSGRNISWFFDSGTGLELNNSFIARPEAGRWEEWYQSIRDYRQITRNRIGKEEPALNCRISARNPATIHFDKFGYGLNLIPGEEIEFEGKISPPLTHAHAALILYFDFELKSRGEELSNVVRKRIGHADSLMIPDEPEIFKMRLQVPDFRSDSFSISPVLRLESPNAVVSMDVIVSDLSLTVAASPERNVLLSKIQSMIRSQKDSISFTTPRYPEWMHGNFVMGFAFLWDRELWDPERGEFTVEEYCRKMEEEFGGLQSVILWHSYPNIGIDERNQFDFFHIMPGGLEGLKKVVVDFQVNGVRVFLAYNPWDLDTRRPGESDGRELGIILDSTWADGIFLDTWNSAAGMNSIFSSERLFSDEFRKKNIVFIAELFPEYKDMIGSHALAGSWGQQINPFHFTDLSQLKWIAPEHKQYYIERLATDRHQMLAHAWINGQGIQVWENIFGTMNFWNVRDKMDLRRINSIWKSFGNMYSSDDWQPLIPMNEAGIYASRWTTGG
ncbi:MAG TPA: hypothetical protein VI583_14615, partial [Cyclobacteriaceae bacterium]|nr:hypothetical protein [Cyclobacteriaceae bacterium]